MESRNAYRHLFLVEGFYVVNIGTPVCQHFHSWSVLKIFAIHSEQRQTSLTCLARSHLPAEPSVAPHGPREPEEVWPKSAADGNKSRHMQTHSCRVARGSPGYLDILFCGGILEYRFRILHWYGLRFIILSILCAEVNSKKISGQFVCQECGHLYPGPLHVIGGLVSSLSVSDLIHIENPQSQRAMMMTEDWVI